MISESVDAVAEWRTSGFVAALPRPLGGHTREMAICCQNHRIQQEKGVSILSKIRNFKVFPLVTMMGIFIAKSDNVIRIEGLVPYHPSALYMKNGVYKWGPQPPEGEECFC